MAYTIDFMGLPLKNAVVVSAGPWSGSADAIQNCIDAGAAAVITETIVMQEMGLFGPSVYYRDNELFNLSLYGRKSIEEWEADVERIQKKDSFLICSIRGSSPSEIAYIAKKTERLGADALQLDIFAPMDATIEEINIQPQKLYEMIYAVVNSVDVPVTLRLPYHISSNIAYIREVERAGVKAISVVESLKGLSGVDIENLMPETPTFAGYTGRHIRPISLAATATLSQLTDCQICGVGGIEDYRNILEFMMVGAVTAQLGSVVMLQGYNVITETVAALERWMPTHGYQSFDDIRGVALKSLYPYEKVEKTNWVMRMQQPCHDEKCSICISGCMYGALTFSNGQVQLDEKRCTGCGLCAQRCPASLLQLQKRP